MSRDSAKAHYTKQPGDPDEGFITASDAQAAIDDIYDDMSAPAVIADGSVTSGKIAADAVGSAQIATGAVGSGELATDAVTSDKIADGAVSNAHVASDAAIAASKVAGTAVTQADTGTVTNGMLAGSIAKTKVAGTAITAADTGTVTGTMIGTGEVGNGNLAANAVNEAKIASGAVTTVKIEDDAVTTAKIAADAVTSAEIAANAVGASELADNAVDTAAIAADAVTADKIANDTITAAELAAGSVGTSELADDSVTAAKILDGTITANEIQNASITGVKLVNDTITATQIAANAVGSSELADNAVDTAAIAANAVTDDKIVSGVTFTVGSTPPVAPKVGAEWADTSSPPLTVVRKWDGTSWLVWLVTDATVPSIGDAAWGGYMAGIIDTTRVGSIGGTDPSQAGLRYLLIVSPKSLEFTTGKKWKTSDDAGPAATATLWDGLSATEAMYAAGSAYEAATYCRELTFPQDGGSRWYLPAKNELELLYRNLKPTTDPHYSASGANVASDPTGAAYTPGSSDNPSQSGIAAFQQGGAQALEGVSSPYYWSSSEHSAPYAWYQLVGGTYAGYQNYVAKTYPTIRVRPVRRFVL